MFWHLAKPFGAVIQIVFSSPVNCFLHMETQSQTYMQSSLRLNPCKSCFVLKKHTWKSIISLLRKGNAAFLWEFQWLFKKNVISLKYFVLIKCYSHRRDGGQRHTSPGIWQSSSNSAQLQKEPDPYTQNKDKESCFTHSSALMGDINYLHYLQWTTNSPLHSCKTRLCISRRPFSSWWQNFVLQGNAHIKLISVTKSILAHYILSSMP